MDKCMNWMGVGMSTMAWEMEEEGTGRRSEGWQKHQAVKTRDRWLEFLGMLGILLEYDPDIWCSAFSLCITSAYLQWPWALNALWNARSIINLASFTALLWIGMLTWHALIVAGWPREGIVNWVHPCFKFYINWDPREKMVWNSYCHLYIVEIF